MTTTRTPRRAALLAGAVAIAAGLVAGLGGAARADDVGGVGKSNLQLTVTHQASDEEYTPEQCFQWQLLNPDEQKYRTTNNAPFTYYDSVYGTAWFDVACGRLAFFVPAGRQALVDLTAVAELDCAGKEATSGGWCGGRFLINGAAVADPLNTGRADSYAWDSAPGGTGNWQANTLAQQYLAECRVPNNGNGCIFKVQLQSRLEAGATSVWIDDLTMRVDVSEGAVSKVAI